MKQAWSPKWISSRQPRKQRKYRRNAPMHARRKFVAAHLSPVLRERLGKRSLPVRKGDEVRMMRGKLKGMKGVVERVDLRESKVYVDAMKVKKTDGSEVMRALRPSNLMITSLNLDDKARQRVLERAKPKEKEPEKPKEKKPKEAKKEEKKKPEKEKKKTKERPKKPKERKK